MKKIILICIGIISYSIGFSQCYTESNTHTFSEGTTNYRVVKELKTWTEAAACAVSSGGFLVEISSEAENEAVYDGIIAAGVATDYTSVPDGGGIAYIWIGATDKITEGTWLWDGNNDGVGTNFWNGQRISSFDPLTFMPSYSGGSVVGTNFINWGGIETESQFEPDDYEDNQDAGAIALGSWPPGFGGGIAKEWNDIDITNSLYYVIEYPTKSSQTITFDALEAKTFGDDAFDLAATASSNLAVSYTSSDETVATINDNTVTVVGAGTTTITASQSGNDDYNPATDATQTLTVNKTSQTITFDALEAKTFGDDAFDLVATASSNLAVSYTSSDETVATITGNTVTVVGAGSTTITASQSGNDNYNAATDVTQTLTVNKTSQTITFGALEAKTFGDDAFDLSATASSNLAVSYSSSDETVATVDGNTVTVVGAGTTTITASQSGNDDYNPATDATQTLTVNKTSQTITFDALEAKTFGDDTFDLVASSSSNLDVSYMSSDETVATITGNTITIIGAGTTTITASQSGNDDYNPATDAMQTLTVNKTSQTITFDALEAKNFGDEAFDLVASASSNLDVSYMSSDETVATVDGNNITIVGAGSTTITAIQAGNDNYNAASDVAQVLTVNPKILSSDDELILTDWTVYASDNTLYINPNTDNLEQRRYNIYNLAGILIMTFEVNQKSEVDLNVLEPSIYLVKDSAGLTKKIFVK